MVILLEKKNRIGEKSLIQIAKILHISSSTLWHQGCTVSLCNMEYNEKGEMTVVAPQRLLKGKKTLKIQTIQWNRINFFCKE